MSQLQTTESLPAPTPNLASSPASSAWLDRLSRWRVRVALAIVIGVLVEGVVRREIPLNLFAPGWPVLVAGVLIALGLCIRLVSLGTLRKNEVLATDGIYSLCRHPLYLGSTLLFLGIGIILNDGDGAYWILGVPYITLFFTAAVIKEERFLREKFGSAFDAYKSRTPAFIPRGRWQGGDFSWNRALKRGGVKLILSVAMMIISMQAAVMLFTPRAAPRAAASTPIDVARASR